MRDFNRQLPAFADLDDFVIRIKNVVALVTHVADIKSALFARHFRQINDLGRSHKMPRIIFQP